MPSFIGNLAFAGFAALLGLLYAAGGGSARDSLVRDLFVNMVLVLGLQIFVGNTGVLSFGHLGLGGIAAYAMALFAIPIASKARQLPNAPIGVATRELNPLVASLLAVLFVTLVSVLIGLVVARTSGLSATMITLALLFVVRQVAENSKELTNGAGGLSGVPKNEGLIWPFMGACAAIAVATAFRASRSGRMAVATREDELAAGAMGINVFRPRLVAFVVSGLVIGLGAVLFVQSLGSISSNQFSFEFTILLLAMLVVGGMRTVSGAIAGTVFITLGKEVARIVGDGPKWFGKQWPKIDGLPDLFLAGSLLLILLLRPGGLLGDYDFGQLLRRSRWRRGAVDFADLDAARTNAFAAASSNDVPNAATTAATRATMSAAINPAASSPEKLPAGASLEARGLGVTFGGFTAVDDVSITVEPGQVHGLIGPNGAGKTTFINLLTGQVEPTAGSVSLGTHTISGPPHDRARAGIARTFQNLRVFSALSVRENVAVAALAAAQHRSERSGPGVDELLHLSGLSDAADRPAFTLDYGNQRRLEIARAAALRPNYLLLDEPTSGMSESESLLMVDHVRAIARAVDAGVLVVDHDLGFITRVCDYVTVLDQGRVLAVGTPDEIQRNPSVIAAYLGTSA